MGLAAQGGSPGSASLCRLGWLDMEASTLCATGPPLLHCFCRSAHATALLMLRPYHSVASAAPLPQCPSRAFLAAPPLPCRHYHDASAAVPLLCRLYSAAFASAPLPCRLCCRAPAAPLLPCRSYCAATTVPPLLCSHYCAATTAATTAAPLPCHPYSAALTAPPLLQRPCRTATTVPPLVQRPCRPTPTAPPLLCCHYCSATAEKLVTTPFRQVAGLSHPPRQTGAGRWVVRAEVSLALTLGAQESSLLFVHWHGSQVWTWNTWGVGVGDGGVPFLGSFPVLSLFLLRDLPLCPHGEGLVCLGWYSLCSHSPPY